MAELFLRIGPNIHGLSAGWLRLSAPKVKVKAELFKKAGQMLSMCQDVCLDGNQGGTNCNRCTQRLVTLHAQTY